MEAFAEAAASLRPESESQTQTANSFEEDTVSGSDDQIQWLMSRNLLPERQVRGACNNPHSVKGGAGDPARMRPIAVGVLLQSCIETLQLPTGCGTSAKLPGGGQSCCNSNWRLRGPVLPCRSRHCASRRAKF